jgi:hypothetical protein
MSRLFDFNLAGVEVVSESPAVTGSTKAVTKDDEVHFRPGAYQPGTPDGDLLIAHELAHVVQQRGGRGQRTGTRKELEREADRAAALVAHGRAAPILLRAEPTAAYAFDEGEAHDSSLDDAVADKEDAAARPPMTRRRTTRLPAHRSINLIHLRTTTLTTPIPGWMTMR